MKFSVGAALIRDAEAKEMPAPKTPRMLKDNLEDLIKYAKRSENPTFVLDEKCRMLYKNRYASRLTPGLKKGAGIYRFLPEEAGFELGQMQNLQILRTEFSKDEFHCTASVISVVECRVLVLDHISAELGAAAEDWFERMSGYDISIPVPVGGNVSRAFDFVTVNRLLNAAVDRYKTTQPIPFFNSAESLKSLLEQLRKQESKIYEKIKLKISGEEYISAGSERDFVLMIACMAAFCLAAGCEDTVSVEILGEHGFTDIYVEAETALKNSELLSFSKLKYAKDIKNEETGWIYLMKLLSDINLWDFSPTGAPDGKIGFSLRMEVAEDFKDLSLREADTEYISGIIALVFSRLNESNK